jgi:hypothetical protein
MSVHPGSEDRPCGEQPDQTVIATAALAPESFIAAVAAIEFHDDNGGPYALNYAVTNTLHGRGSLDKVTRRTVASAIRTLQAVIREAQTLHAAAKAGDPA